MWCVGESGMLVAPPLQAVRELPHIAMFARKTRSPLMTTFCRRYALGITPGQIPSFWK
jgi:hypothetical protein